MHGRLHMVEKQIAGRGIRDPALLNAMRLIPRENFVEKGFEMFAYNDCPLPIGKGQTISQPYMVALMIEAAEVKSSDTVLEIGAGLGYATAILSRMAAHVFAVERHASLAAGATERLQRLGYDNIDLRCGDGSKGWPKAAPFDAILVSAAAPEVPQALKEQLTVGGRLVIPVGPEESRQTLLKIVRKGPDNFTTQNLGAVIFVPLISEHGGTEDYN
ncbi:MULTISPECIES: protein-L-isoaspartate(D-aspartate) O-methyltransferase [unclassified Rhizobium]|uniref:protein-L-isoaspartate(D-aspartate) O-methyltransferase n=1 Tax=unclassified Rhizobium TaxID=2613769 RepID=UPI000CDF3BF9|nr:MULTISPECIES: protein-L-isoaspartate(D-aspartate) O-methyltransferase [Rhizobium]AVA25097.1 protein-L-isoaspartate O-methyltransferase 3 [Rhizobium sp. NXC24]UWU24883.1 protein-L-isoaspartate(D-aspartate) O-methyltransferase [Rhizobium tropici]